MRKNVWGTETQRNDQSSTDNVVFQALPATLIASRIKCGSTLLVATHAHDCTRNTRTYMYMSISLSENESTVNASREYSDSMATSCSLVWMLSFCHSLSNRAFNVCVYSWPSLKTIVRIRRKFTIIVTRMSSPCAIKTCNRQ